MPNPYTEFSRPQKAVIAEAVSLIEEAGVPSVPFFGTSFEALARLASERLVKSQGAATSVVCYGGSRFALSPRVEQTVSVLILSADTRVRDGLLDALDASRVVGAALDDHVTETSGEDGYAHLDKWEASSEEVLDVASSHAAAAILMTFTVKQYN